MHQDAQPPVDVETGRVRGILRRDGAPLFDLVLLKPHLTRRRREAFDLAGRCAAASAAVEPAQQSGGGHRFTSSRSARLEGTG